MKQETNQSLNDIAKLLGSRGGQKTRKLYGRAHFKRISALAAKARKAKALQRKIAS